MIWLVTFFVRRGLSERVAKPVAIATALVVAALLLWALWATWLHFHDKSVIERHEEKITKQVDAVSSEAAASASAAVDHSRNEVERTNEQARDAASDSADPLGDGLRSLRGARSDKPPAR